MGSEGHAWERTLAMAVGTDPSGTAAGWGGGAGGKEGLLGPGAPRVGLQRVWAQPGCPPRGPGGLQAGRSTARFWAGGAGRGFRGPGQDWIEGGKGSSLRPGTPSLSTCPDTGRTHRPAGEAPRPCQGPRDQPLPFRPRPEACGPQAWSPLSGPQTAALLGGRQGQLPEGMTLRWPCGTDRVRVQGQSRQGLCCWASRAAGSACGPGAPSGGCRARLLRTLESGGQGRTLCPPPCPTPGQGALAGASGRGLGVSLGQGQLWSCPVLPTSSQRWGPHCFGETAAQGG